MFEQVLAALADAQAGGQRQALDADAAMSESIDRFTAPTTGEETIDPMATPEETMQATDEAVDEVTDPDGHTHSSGGSLAWGGHKNGRIPTDQLTRVSGGHLMESNAAQAWNRMVADARADSVTLALTDSYRSYAGQVDVRRRKGNKVATATPGTSIHGWGKAIDVAGDAARAWMQRNGARYGWVWPKWAQRKGTKSFEPWHFEFRPGGQ